MTNPAQPTLQAQLDAHKARSSTEMTAIFDAQVAAIRADGVLANSLKVGDHAPDFTLPDALGRSVSLTEALANGPVALTFYRGEWCPYCNMQLKAYQEIIPDITALGATLIAISPQSPDHSLSLAEKRALTFAVVSDEGNTVARRYGLVFQYDNVTRDFIHQRGLDLARFNGDDSWELPVPATYLIAQDGVIRLAFIDPDFRRRMEPADLLAGLRALNTKTR